jgi:hypothetical protein
MSSRSGGSRNGPLPLAGIGMASAVALDDDSTSSNNVTLCQQKKDVTSHMHGCAIAKNQLAFNLKSWVCTELNW